LLNLPEKQYMTFQPYLKYVATLHRETVALELRHCRCHRSVCEHDLQRRR